MIIGVGYHYVRPAFKYAYAGIAGLTTAEFRSQLEILGRQGEFISQGDLRRAFYEQRELPKRAWLITFDDGLKEQFEHALPILDELDIPAIFFVSTMPLSEKRPLSVHLTHLLRANVAPRELRAAIQDAAFEFGITIEEVDSSLAARQYRYDTLETAQLKYLLNFSLSAADTDRVVNRCFDRLLGGDRAETAASLYMEREHLRELAARDMLGSHTHSHRPLGILTESEINREIVRSCRYLESWTGRQVDSLSYPYGSRHACSLAAGQIAGEAGIRLGFTMERTGIDTKALPLFLPRCAPNDLPGGSTACWTAERIFKEISSSSWYRDESVATYNAE